MNKLSAAKILEGIQESHRRTALKISPHERDRTLKAYGRFEGEEGVEQGDPLIDVINEINSYVHNINDRLQRIEEKLLGNVLNEPGRPVDDRSVGLNRPVDPTIVNAYSSTERYSTPFHQDRRSDSANEQTSEKIRK